MDLLNDNDAAIAALRDAEAAEVQMQALAQKALDDWRASTAEVKQALTAGPSAQGF